MSVCSAWGRREGARSLPGTLPVWSTEAGPLVITSPGLLPQMSPVQATPGLNGATNHLLWCHPLCCDRGVTSCTETGHPSGGCRVSLVPLLQLCPSPCPPPPSSRIWGRGGFKGEVIKTKKCPSCRFIYLRANFLQVKKCGDKHCTSHFREVPRGVKFTKTESRTEGSRCWGWGWEWGAVV